jgi:hypothetical protein
MIEPTWLTSEQFQHLADIRAVLLTRELRKPPPKKKREP